MAQYCIDQIKDAFLPQIFFKATISICQVRAASPDLAFLGAKPNI